MERRKITPKQKGDENDELDEDELGDINDNDLKLSDENISDINDEDLKLSEDDEIKNDK